MRKLLSIAIGTLLTFVVFVNYTFAQDVAYNKIPADLKINPNLTLSNNDFSASESVTIDEKSKLQKSFNSYYKKASDVTWYRSNKNYQANFNNDGRKCRAMFDKQGIMYYAITCGSEKDLPKETRKMIKSTYVDFEIGDILEVSSQDKTALLVYLKDDQDIVIARVVDDGLDEYARYSTQFKSKPQRKGRNAVPNK
ncbi:MAG TPA: hypothetical protein VM888_00730 [Chitinophagaceae bacterium]|nr:hypothetical protein [Chitinophagaceae bacterium]